MTTNKTTCVSRGKESFSFLNNKMNWSIYKKLLKTYQNKDFRTLRLRLAFFLLAVTQAKISEILVLKVHNLRTLEQESFIELKNQTILIQNQKIRAIINERRDDVNYLNKIKYDDDFIFTNEIDGKIPLRRETFTRIINKELQSIGVDLQPPRKLSSRSFQTWDKN
jgi:site-specific recombinase XerD